MLINHCLTALSVLVNDSTSSTGIILVLLNLNKFLFLTLGLMKNFTKSFSHMIFKKGIYNPLVYIKQYKKKY